MENEAIKLEEIKRLVKLFPYPESRIPFQGCLNYVTQEIPFHPKIEEACKKIPEYDQYQLCLAYIVEHVVQGGWIDFACTISRVDLYTIKHLCSTAMDKRFVFACNIPRGA